MPNSISSTGLTTATQAELLAQFTAALQAIYGEDINLESDTPDGQWVNIFIQSILDIEDLITQVYNSFDPDNAIGNVLDQRVAINGIQRQAGTFTTTYVTIVNSQSVNLYGLDQTVNQVYTVADNAGNQWELVTSNLGLSAGTHSLLFQAAEPGQVLTVPNTITVPVTIVLGVTSINNPTTYSTLGVNEESDAALRIRRQKSVSLQSQGYFQGLLAALENINGVTSAFVIENDSAGTDSDNIPGHSIWVIVAGTPDVDVSVAYNSTTTYQYGDIASSAGTNYISVTNDNVGNLVSNATYWRVYNPIAQAIYNYRNAGCGMYQAIDGVQNSYTVTQIDGSLFPVYWSGVQSETLYIKFVANSLNGRNPPDIAAIKSGIVSGLIPGVYEEVNINALGTLVQEIDPNTLITSAGFCDVSNGSYQPTWTPNTKDTRFSIIEANVIVLPMIVTCTGGIQTIVAGLVTTTTIEVASGGATIQFAQLGGWGAMTWSVFSGAGSINAATGLFTSAGAGTTVVKVTDALTNTATATISVV